MKTSDEIEKRFKSSMRKAAIAIGVVITLLVVTIVILAASISAEIDACGGVAKCLGGAVREFDDARKGEQVMQVDHAFVIGDSHKVCEDYARSGFTDDRDEHQPHIGYAFLSDGCSGSDDTDFGARLLVSSAEDFFRRRRDIEDLNDMRSIILNASFAQRSLALKQECLDATLLGVWAGSRVHILGMGDGLIVIKMKSGNIIVFDIESPCGYPIYPSYLLDRYRLQGVQKEMQKVEEKGWHVGYTFFGEDGFVDYDKRFFWSNNAAVFMQEWSRDDEDDHDGDCIETVALFSDGVKSFLDSRRETVPWEAVVREMIAFKGHRGQFVKRRMHGFLRACERRGWSHHDDVSMAAVYLGSSG